MDAKQWIKAAELNGWRVDRTSGQTICLCCSKQGCYGTITASLGNLGPAPDPCPLDHVGYYSRPVFEKYRALVSELRHRRMQIGLSQEDLCSAMGMADGYVNKLEAFAKVASPDTLFL